MTDKQIEQNAFDEAVKYSSFGYEQTSFADGYIEGVHSRDKEIESIGEQLKNAVSMLKDIYEDDDYFCTRLLDIPEEEKMCEIYCDKEGVQCDCILRYLKHYKKE